MCYSAQIENDYRRYMRVVGPENALSIEDFVRKYWERQVVDKLRKIPKAVDAWFTRDRNGDQAKIAGMIETFNEKEIANFEQLIFKQRKRVADAQRVLQTKTTKKATEDVRIGTEKVVHALGKLAKDVVDRPAVPDLRHEVGLEADRAAKAIRQSALAV